MGVNSLRRVFSWLMRKIYTIDYDGRESLKALGNYLKEGSIILCFNHLSFDDALIMLAALFSEVGGEITKMIIPGSRRHWGKLWGWIMRLAPLLGFKVLPVVQHYERGKGLYSPEHISSLDRRFVRAVYKILGTEGGVLLFTPEGHRTETRELQAPQKGMESLLRIVERKGFRTKIMPVGIEPPEGYSRRFNLGRRFAIHFGPLLSVEEIDKRARELHLSPGWVIMKEIAQLLPGHRT